MHLPESEDKDSIFYDFVNDKVANRPKVQFSKFWKEIKSKKPPREFDWVQQNLVSRVKRQKSCGACWAISACGTIETAYALKTGVLVEVSEQ